MLFHIIGWNNNPNNPNNPNSPNNPYNDRYSQVNSLWFFCHIIGWATSMLLLRDWRACLCKSIHFELLELSFQFLIPDFRECWYIYILITRGDYQGYQGYQGYCQCGY